MFDFTRMTFRSPSAQPVHFTTKPTHTWLSASPVIGEGKVILPGKPLFPGKNKVPLRNFLVNEDLCNSGLFAFETGCRYAATSFTRSPALELQRELWLTVAPRAPAYATHSLILP